MTNKEIAAAFAAGATKGKSNSMFIEGNVIYSYGYHFPLAVFIPGSITPKYYLNSDKYSQTTSCHQGIVHRAIANTHADIIEADTQKLKELC